MGESAAVSQIQLLDFEEIWYAAGALPTESADVLARLEVASAWGVCIACFHRVKGKAGHAVTIEHDTGVEFAQALWTLAVAFVSCRLARVGQVRLGRGHTAWQP
eukprot:5329703-Amphidinium_carterae.1